MLNFLQSVQFVKEVEKKIIEYEKDIDFNEAIMLYEIAKHDADLVKTLPIQSNKIILKILLSFVLFIPQKWVFAAKTASFAPSLSITVVQLK
ncbi:hypothetical protein [Caldicellulosiruptor acetigenus]|uniref:hypothetical protein n=1 Tax=Caldicellulosiruptor acetigenus TaxID=301953 RepID=UPI0001E9849D|nr:hypothetical protein [Caldicellulosiruptor acetigenus]